MSDSDLRIFMAVYLLTKAGDSLHPIEVLHSSPIEPELTAHYSDDGTIHLDLEPDPEAPPPVIALMSGVAMGVATCCGNLVTA